MRENDVSEYNKLIDFNSLGDLMKTVMKFLSLILCFELILGPVQGSLVLATPAYAGDCPAGQAWNSQTGRCNVTADLLNTNTAVDSCNGDKTCLENLAKNKSGNTGDNPFSDGSKATWGEKGSGSRASAVAIGIPLLIVITILASKPKGVKCRPPSLLLMYAAGAALAVGEIYGFFHHKAKLDDIQKKWDETVVKKNTTDADAQRANSTEAQSQAFEYLAQNEDQVADTAKTKKGFYIAATSLFAAGVLSATVEQIQLGIAKKVLNTPPLPGDTTYPVRAQAARERIRKLTCNSDAKTNFEIKDNPAVSTTSTAPITPPTQPDVIIMDPHQTNNQPLVTEPFNNGTEVQLNNSGGGSHWDLNGNRFESILFSSPADPRFSKFESKEELERMKQVAAYNLSTAEDAEQLLQLMNEFNSIQLENYTQLSYIEEEQGIELKKVPLLAEVSKAIAESFVSSAHAEDSGCATTTAADADAAAAAAAAEAAPKEDNMGKILGLVGTALPLAMGLKSILGGVKSQGGIPVSPTELNQKVGESNNWFMKAIGKPYTRIAINGVLGTWMGVMAGHMQKVKDDAEARAKTLREMKEEFVTANGLISCKPGDRDNSCKPICYCYTQDNKRNPDRAKDKVCTNTYAKFSFDPFGNNGNDKVCLDQSNKVDAKCACRAKKSCMKIISKLNMSGFKPGTFKMISAGAGPAQDLFNGNVGGGNISDSAGINAAKIRNAAEAMLKKADPAAAKAKDGFAAQLSKGLIAAGSGLSMGGGSRGALPTSPAGAAAALDKEIKEHKKEKAAATANSGNGGGGFGLEAEEPDVTADVSGEDIEISEIMAKEMDMGDSDVNKGSHTNIFEVLSNRYQRSGMRRLLDPSSNVPADAPSQHEISE